MAKFNAEIPTELLKQFQDLANGGAEKMMSEMTRAGADVVYEKIKSNMRKVFKDSKELEKCLVKTKTYKTSSDDGINTKVAFYGYFKNKQGKEVPAPLIANAREYGTINGEAKKPFVRPAFNKSQITQAMLKVQGEYIKDDK